MKYIISFDTEFGCVSAESENPEELTLAYPKLQSVADQLSNKTQARKKRNSNNGSDNHRESRSTEEMSETTAILRELESNILSSKFFDVPRTTGETRERLETLTGKRFASRKVSQALGILKDKGALKRKGKRNFFQYSLS
jgi:hypothetical protein